nr:DUF6624 domain-containing protein [Shewanella algae]
MGLLFLLLLIPSFTNAEIDKVLQSQLLEMAKLDQSVRKQLGEAGWDKASKNLHTKLSTVDHENTKSSKQY